MKTQKHVINILPFPYPEKEKLFGFKLEKTNGEFPLRKFEIPLELWHKHKVDLENIDCLYSDFISTEDCKYITKVDLTKSLFFSKHYYNFLMHEHFKDIADVIYPNFINRNEIWFESRQKSTADYWLYFKFTLHVQVALLSKSPELVVAFDGTSSVLKKSILDLAKVNISTKLVKTVIYNNRIYKYKKEYLPPQAKNNLDKVFPVLNLNLSKALNITLPKRDKSVNKYTHYFRVINILLKKHLETPEFKKIIPHSGKWLELNDKAILSIPNGSGLLQFNTGVHINPYEGIKQYKPCESVPVGHYKYFFICHESSVGLTETFISYAQKDLGFIDFGKFLSMPITVDTDKNIVFKNSNDPLPEIEEALFWSVFEPNVRYIAIYISPYHKVESDTQKKAIYYKVKKRLLDYKITSQAIYDQTFTTDNFKYCIANLAIAILAKLGGIPWRLKTDLDDELIIGIGAFKSTQFNARFLASTFCFRNDGRFEMFDTLPADSNVLLAGAIGEAVENYRESHKEAKRIIIHFYKRMSGKELSPIIKTLRSLDCDIPVVIVSINKTCSDDYVLFDTGSPNLMPYNGTYISIGNNSYLLCNNERFSPTDDNHHFVNGHKIKS